MTQIDFYVQVSDKHETVRKLCNKALASGAKLVIWTLDSAASERLSRMLWSIPSIGFVPHCSSTDPLAARTPIVLDYLGEIFPHDQVLINLRSEVPAFFSRFERLIELVSADDDDDKQHARERFRYYRDRGYEIRTHDLTRNLASAAIR